MIDLLLEEFGISWAATPEAKLEAIDGGLRDYAALSPRLAIWGDVVSVVIETARTTERGRLDAMQADLDRTALFELMQTGGGQASARR